MTIAGTFPRELANPKFTKDIFPKAPPKVTSPEGIKGNILRYIINKEASFPSLFRRFTSLGYFLIFGSKGFFSLFLYSHKATIAPRLSPMKETNSPHPNPKYDKLNPATK